MNLVSSFLKRYPAAIDNYNIGALEAILDMLVGLKRVVVQHKIFGEKISESYEESWNDKIRQGTRQFCQWLRSFTNEIEIVVPAGRYFSRYDDDQANVTWVTAALEAVAPDSRKKQLIRLAGIIALVALGVELYWALRSAN